MFKKWCWENWTATWKRMKLEHSLTPSTKRNSKWMKDLDIRPDTIKLLEENIGQTLSDINDSNISSDPPLRVLTIKTKINKWDLIKLQSFCTAKETLNKMKRQPTEWEKTFANKMLRTGVPIVAQWLTRLVPMRTWLQSLASLSGLRNQHCHEL